MRQNPDFTLLKRASIICFAFSLLFILNASSQKLPWDSTSRPNVYYPMVNMFKTLPHSKKDIVFLGNSITFWGDWSELLGSLYVKDRGIPGDNTYGVLERVGEIIKGQPAKVFILIGINDLAAHIPDSIIILNTCRIADKIRSGSPRTKIYLQTILPTNHTFNKLKGHYNKGEDIKKINAALKKFAAEKRIGWIDLYSHFIDESGKLKKEYSWDGVHLTRKGYNVWINVLRQDGYLKGSLK